MAELPGSEIPKEYRPVATDLVQGQGWRYDASGKGHPVLYPADPTQSPLRIPTTPTKDKG